MATLEPHFVDGLIVKTLIIGVVASALGWWFGSLFFGGSILLGVLVSVFNLRALVWIGNGMVRSATAGNTSASLWSILLVIKLLLLFVITFVCIQLVGADAVGYTIGYSTFLLALLWQAGAHTLRQGDDDGLQDGDTESL